MNKPNIILDFDSTLIQVEALDIVAEVALACDIEKEKKLQEFRDITAQGMIGRLPFDQSLERRLKLFNADKKIIRALVNILKNKVSVSALNNMHFFEENRDNIYVVSGGFREYIKPVVQLLGLKSEHIIANSFLFNFEDEIIGYDVNNPLAQANGKVLALEKLNLKGKTIVIGDGITDYQIKSSGQADMFIAYCENIKRKQVIERADFIAFSFSDVVKLVMEMTKLIS